MTFVHPEVRAVLDLLAANAGPKIADIPAPMARQMFSMMTQMFEAPAEDVPFADAHFAGPAGLVPVRIYQPVYSTDTPRPVLVYFHGGGWVIGDVNTHHAQMTTMANALGMTIVFPDYRLAPEHPFPAAVDDCLACARWVASSPPEIAHAVSGVAFAGDSAGGNLTAVAAQALTGQINVIGQLLFFPGVDFTAHGGSLEEFGEGHLLTKADMDFFQHAYAPTADLTDIRLSPLKAASLAGQPPAVVMVCGLDPLRDQGRAYAQKLAGDGVRVSFHELPGQIHSCINLRKAIPSAHAHLLAVCADFAAIIAA